MYITDKTPQRPYNHDWWEADVSSLARFRCIAYRFPKERLCAMPKDERALL